MINWDVIPKESQEETVDRCYYSLIDSSRIYRNRILELKQEFLQKMLVTIQDHGLWQWLIGEERCTELCKSFDGKIVFSLKLEEAGFIISIEAKSETDTIYYEISKSGIVDRGLIPYIDEISQGLLEVYMKAKKERTRNL
ncbi:MAG: hypothetical protein JXA60_02505 [Candidatus Coatesbacteria bacterium]|nr:hypothetical protein [Candidatus Coatesbacteria bacterium]